jgi:ketosteroid isomerase-like protein
MAGRWSRTLAGVLACVMASAVCPGCGQRPVAGVEAALGAYAHKVTSMDAPAIASMFAPDGELLEPGIQALKGRAAIQRFLASLTGFPVESARMLAESTQVWDHAAFQRSAYSQRVAIGDKPATEYSGRFALQWSSDASGAWRIRRLMMQPVTP